jgi:hypothetical protein
MVKINAQYEIIRDRWWMDTQHSLGRVGGVGRWWWIIDRCIRRSGRSCVVRRSSGVVFLSLGDIIARRGVRSGRVRSRCCVVSWCRIIPVKNKYSKSIDQWNKSTNQGNNNNNRLLWCLGGRVDDGRRVISWSVGCSRSRCCGVRIRTVVHRWNWWW